MAVLYRGRASLLVLALLAAVVAAAKPPNGGKPTTPITTTTSSSGGSSSSRTTTTTSSSSGQAQPKDAILPNIHKVVASHKYLWPVNANTMVNITLSGAKDPAGGPVTLKIDHVTSTQPPKAYKAPLCPDSQIGPDADWVTLRAERLNNTARVYRIYYKATTSRGTFRKGVVWVCVPASNPNMENVLNSCPTAAKLFKKWNAGGCGGPGDYMGHNHLNQAPLKLNPPKLGDPIKPLPTTKTAAAAATGSPSKGHPHQPAASKAHPTAHLPKPDAQQPASTTTTAAPATSTSIPSSSSSRHLTAKSDTELIPFLRLTFKHAKCYQVDFASPPFLTNVTRLAGELVGFSLGKAGTVAVVKNGEDADCQENHAAGNVAVNFPLVIMAAAATDGDVLPIIISQTDQGKLFNAWCGAGGPHAAMCADWDLSDAAVVLDYGKPVIVARSSIGPIIMSAD